MNYYVLDETVACNLCWDCHLYTSEHTSPEPKLSRRNEGENCFFPHQGKKQCFPQASISKCTTNVLWVLLLQTHTNTRQHQACEEFEHVGGAQGMMLRTCSMVLCPHRSCPSSELWMLCQHLLVCIRTIQATTADKLEAQRSLQTKMNSPCLVGHSFQATIWL